MVQSARRKVGHVAVIMDGNGRWAERRGLPRLMGHRAGSETVRRIVEGAARSGVGMLTLYAFSSDNWKRPSTEVIGLMRFFEAQGEVKKAISIIKKRSGGHEKAIRELTIDRKGLRIGEPLRQFHRVLTGIPVLEKDASA